MALPEPLKTHFELYRGAILSAEISQRVRTASEEFALSDNKWGREKAEGATLDT